MGLDELNQGKYLKVAEGEYRCRDCNEVIMQVTRYVFPTPDRFFGPLLESEPVYIPYCPKCEQKPD